ncbi:MAG: glycosyltransferase family 39 protein [Anaerolineae bacterium]
MSIRIPRWAPLVLGVAVLLVAAGLRFHELGTQSLWNDEGNSFVQAGRSLAEIAEHAARDIHPPGYYWLLAGWKALTGDTEFALRSLSVLASVLSVAFALALGRRLYGVWAGLVAALFVALNTFSIYYAQEARMYALLALLGAAGMWALVGLVLRPKGRWAVALGLINAAGLYTQYAYPLLLAAQGFLVLIALVQRRHERHTALRILGLYAGSLVLSGLLFLPLAPTAWAQVTGWPSTGEPVPFAEALRAIGVWLAYGPTVMTAALAIPFIVLVFGLLDADGRTDGRWRTLVPVLWVVVPILAFLAAGLYRPQNLKFLIASQIGFALWLAHGLWVLWTLQARSRKGGSTTALHYAARVAAAGAFAWIVGVMVLNLPALYIDPALQRADYRAIVTSIETRLRPGDAVILDAPNQNEVFQYYYSGDAPVYLLPPGLGGNDAETRAAVEAILQSHDRTWTVFWGEAERDPNRVVETSLDAGAFEAGEQWYGDVRLALHIMPAPMTEACANDVQFGAHITLQDCALSALEASPGDALQVQFTWETDAPLDTRYKVFVQLLDANGQLVAQRDSEPGGGLALTTTWAADEPVTDRHALFLPDGLPPGEYRLIAGLYALDPPNERLPVSSGGDALELGVITIR